MPVITKKEAELKDFVIVKDKKSNSISRIIAPHSLQIGIDGFAKSGLVVKGDETIEGSLIILGGVKGAFTLPNGTPSVRAGAGMSVVSLANGAIVLSTLDAVNNNIFVGRGITSSSSDLGITLSLLPEFKPVTASSGINSTIINDVISLSIDRTDIVSFAGGIFTGAINAAAGLSGSLQVLSDGITAYLTAGAGIEIVTSSSGQIQISSTAKLYSFNEEPTALITSGSLITGIQLSKSPDPSSSLMLFVNGQLMTQGNDNDYTLGNEIVTFNTPFLADDVIRSTFSYVV